MTATLIATHVLCFIAGGAVMALAVGLGIAAKRGDAQLDMRAMGDIDNARRGDWQ